jgi:hypothetical protein
MSTCEGTSSCCCSPNKYITWKGHTYHGRQIPYFLSCLLIWSKMSKLFIIIFLLYWWDNQDILILQWGRDCHSTHWYVEAMFIAIFIAVQKIMQSPFVWPVEFPSIKLPS